MDSFDVQAIYTSEDKEHSKNKWLRDFWWEDYKKQSGSTFNPQAIIHFLVAFLSKVKSQVVNCIIGIPSSYQTFLAPSTKGEEFRIAFQTLLERKKLKEVSSIYQKFARSEIVIVVSSALKETCMSNLADGKNQWFLLKTEDILTLMGTPRSCRSEGPKYSRSGPSVIQ